MSGTVQATVRLRVERHGLRFEFVGQAVLPADEEQWWRAVEDGTIERFRREMESDIPRDDITIERIVGFDL